MTTTTIDRMINSANRTWAFEDRPDLAEAGHFCAALALVLDLREVARKGAANTEPTLRGPEEELAAMLAQLHRWGGKLAVPQEIVTKADASTEGFIQQHLDYSGYENKWVALLHGCQDLAKQLSVTVSDIAEGFEQTLADLEQEQSTDPEILRAMEGLSRCSAFLRLVLANVDQAGELVEA